MKCPRYLNALLFLSHWLTTTFGIMIWRVLLKKTPATLKIPWAINRNISDFVHQLAICEPNWTVSARGLISNSINMYWLMNISINSITFHYRRTKTNRFLLENWCYRLNNIVYLFLVSRCFGIKVLLTTFLGYDDYDLEDNNCVQVPGTRRRSRRLSAVGSPHTMYPSQDYYVSAVPDTSKPDQVWIGRMVTYYTLNDCEERNGVNGADLWVVVDSYVLDLTAFIQHHPAGSRKIIQKKKQLGPDITRNFVDHFGHTVRAFREACRQYDKQQTPTVLRFRETPEPGVKVVILGKIRN